MHVDDVGLRQQQKLRYAAATHDVRRTILSYAGPAAWNIFPLKPRAWVTLNTSFNSYFFYLNVHEHCNLLLFLSYAACYDDDDNDDADNEHTWARCVLAAETVRRSRTVRLDERH